MTKEEEHAKKSAAIFGALMGGAVGLAVGGPVGMAAGSVLGAKACRGDFNGSGKTKNENENRKE